MNRRMFAGMMAGAAICSTGKFTTVQFQEFLLGTTVKKVDFGVLHQR
jgi:hypothetical protein